MLDESKQKLRLLVQEDAIASFGTHVTRVSTHQAPSTLELLGDFSNGGFCDEHLAALLLHLPHTVTTLKLGNNYCRSKGATILANLLMDTERKLHSIDLSLQHTGELGGTLDLCVLGSALGRNLSLRHLDLSFNMLSFNDITCLIDAISTNNTLYTLNLCKTGLDDALVQVIGENLPNMKALQRLNILANRFGDSGANALLRGLQSHVRLRKLDMPRGYLASDQIDYLLAINTGGRRLLTNCVTDSSDSESRPACPIGLWPYLFERVNCCIADSNIRASALFFLLQDPATFRNT
jgi:hypothetical protein